LLRQRMARELRACEKNMKIRLNEAGDSTSGQPRETVASRDPALQAG
jgi:hypothetical protein